MSPQLYPRSYEAGLHQGAKALTNPAIHDENQIGVDMSNRSGPTSTHVDISWRALWQQLQFPLLVGITLAAVACPLTALAFGINSSSIFLMSSIGGSCLAIPLLIVAISYYLDFQYASYRNSSSRTVQSPGEAPPMPRTYSQSEGIQDQANLQPKADENIENCAGASADKQIPPPGCTSPREKE